MNNIRQLESQTPRIESGAIKFGNDWAGTFIRGDASFHYATCLDVIINHTEDSNAYEFAKASLKGLLKLLASSNELK